MSLEKFPFIEIETIENSIIKREFLKIYHQQAAISNDSDQNIELILGEKIVIIRSVMHSFNSK